MFVSETDSIDISDFYQNNIVMKNIIFHKKLCDKWNFIVNFVSNFIYKYIYEPCNERTDYIFSIEQQNFLEKIIFLNYTKEQEIEDEEFYSKVLNSVYLIIITTLKNEEDLYLSYLAGFLKSLILNYTSFKTIKNINLSLPVIIHSLSKQKNYDADYLKYSLEEIKLCLDMINYEHDLYNDFCGIKHLSENIHTFIVDNKIFVENIQLIYLLNAMKICVNLPINQRLKKIQEIYLIMSNKKISLATPSFINLRTKYTSYASCFISKLDDNPDSILSGMITTTKITRNSGGHGINLSRIRSIASIRLENLVNENNDILKVKNDNIKKINILSCASLFNAITETFSQAGGKRTAAITISLDIWHADIQEFLLLNSEVGDSRLKAYDIFPQVVIPDEFMFKLLKKEDWYLLCPKEILTLYNIHLDELYGENFSNMYNTIINNHINGIKKLECCKIINSNKLFKLVVERQLESGLPYMFFKCTANNLNPNKDTGIIAGGNLCMESFSNFRAGEDNITELTHCCNLLSVNLALVENDKEITYLSKLGVEILNLILEQNEAPIESATRHNNLYRTIGVGVLGLHDYLSQRKIHFEESKLVVSDLFENIFLSALEKSIELSKIFGPFNLYNQSEYAKGKILGKTIENFKNSKYFARWQESFKNLELFGIYNSQLLAIAPNTSTSMYSNATASVLPIYKSVFLEQNSKGVAFRTGRYSPLRKEYYKAYYEMDCFKINEIIQSIQSFVDQGISFEKIWNLEKTLKFANIKQDFVDVWQKKIKTIYYIRSKIPVKEMIKEQEDNCSNCSL